LLGLSEIPLPVTNFNLKDMNRFNLSLLITSLLLQFLGYSVNGQEYPCEKTMVESLQQTAWVLNKPESKALWNVSLNAPIIIIDHFNNKMFFTSIEDGRVQAIKEERGIIKYPWQTVFSITRVKDMLLLFMPH
jgi:outer membrane protein assembly factor BamB